MKIGLDFDNKTITLESVENMGKFFKAVKKLLPKGEWKKYKLQTNTTINYSYPIYYTYDWCNYDNWRITYDVNSSGDYDISSGDNTLTTNVDDQTNVIENYSTNTVKIPNQMIVEIQ